MPKKKSETDVVEEAREILEMRICGIKLSDIRKAYFTKKIPQMLGEIMSKGKVDEKELGRLTEELEKLRNEEVAVATALAEKVPSIQLIEDPKPPTVKQLTSEMTAEEKDEFKKWLTEKDWSVQKTKQLMRDVAKALIQKSKIPKQAFMDYAHELVGLLGYLNEDRVWKEQLYMKRLTAMIDTYGISRREAEDRAKVTSEYADYKNAQQLLEQVDQFVMNCKKEYGGEQ